MSHSKFQVRLSSKAQQDIRDMLLWSFDRFGADAAQRYNRLLQRAVADVAANPACAGSRSRQELGIGIRSYHLRLSRKNMTPPLVGTPRHFILYDVQGEAVRILRVFHDSRYIRSAVE